MKDHSKAPWKTKELGHKDSGRWLITAEGGQLAIAETCGMAPDAEDKANACLIKSAPRLLEGLEEAIVQITHMHEEPEYSIASMEITLQRLRRIWVDATGGRLKSK